MRYTILSILFMSLMVSADTPPPKITIGTIDGNARSANGASVVKSKVYMQTADATHPGLLGISAQTFAGAKTFTGLLSVADGTQGTVGQCLVSQNNTGLAQWQTCPGGSGADRSLSNLANVGINDSLTPNTDNAFDLGSAARNWANGFIGLLKTPSSVTSVDIPSRTLNDTAANPAVSWDSDGEVLISPRNGNIRMQGRPIPSADNTYNIGDTGFRYVTTYTTGVDAGASPLTLGNLGVTWTWPATDGSNGQCLTTNASGVLSFASCGGGGGGANQTLSNLTDPTAINADLLPGDASRYLGNGSGNAWRGMYMIDAIFDDTSNKAFDIANRSVNDFQGNQVATFDRSGDILLAPTSGVIDAQASTSSFTGKMYVGAADATVVSNANPNLLFNTGSGNHTVAIFTGPQSTTAGALALITINDGSFYIQGVASNDGTGASAAPLLINPQGGDVTIKSLKWPTSDGDAGDVMTTDGAGHLALQPATTTGAEFFKLFEDFSTGGYFGSGQIISDHSWSSIQSGGPSFTTNGSVAVSDANHPGVLQITMSSAGGGDGGGISTGVFGGATNFAVVIGGGQLVFQTSVYIDALSNGTDNASINLGLCDSPAWAAAGNCVETIYQSVTSLNWYCLNVNGMGNHTETSTIPVTAGWHNIKMVIDDAGTEVDTFVDGVSACVNTQNIPTVKLPPMLTGRKTLGSSPWYWGIDYISLTKKFTTPR